MADFKIHTISGGIAGAGVSVLAFCGNFVSLSAAALGVFFAIVASSLPDIDSDTGRPRKFVLSSLEILAPAVLMVSAADFSLENLLILGIGVFFLVHGPLGFMIDKFTRHRGAWHSIPMAVICALVIYLAFYRSFLFTRIFFALVFFVCFVLHLLLDEIYALKYLGLGTKRSFGSAFKFTGANFRQTFLMYAAIVSLSMICLIESAPGGGK